MALTALLPNKDTGRRRGIGGVDCRGADCEVVVQAKHKPMRILSEPELKGEVQRMLAEGTMPSPEQVQKVVEEVRAKYRLAVLEARRLEKGTKHDQRVN